MWLVADGDGISYFARYISNEDADILKHSDFLLYYHPLFSLHILLHTGAMTFIYICNIFLEYNHVSAIALK